MHEDIQVRIIDHPAIQRVFLVGGTVVVIVFIAGIGYAIWTVHQYLVIVGYVWLIAFMALPTIGIVTLVVWLLRFITQEFYYDIGEVGTRVRSLVSSPVLLAPIAQATASAASKLAKTEVVVALPSLFDLLATEEIYYGMTDMILGYKEGGQVVRGPWPNTFAVAGKGRSGKTRRVVFMLTQALMSGAHITVCDPHHNKPDSLYKELAPLAPWIQFALTTEEIVNASNEYLTEMERREQTPVEDGYIHQPRLIVYDEWSKLMTRSEEEHKAKFIEVVTAASQEYAGFKGYACIIGQSWVEDECGGTKIRRALHATFVHRIDQDYAKFLIKPAKWYRQSEELLTGHCLYQDLNGSVAKILMPQVEDRAGVKVAELLMQIAPPKKAIASKEWENSHSELKRENLLLEAPEDVTNTYDASNTTYRLPLEDVDKTVNTYNSTSCELPPVEVTDAQYVSMLREVGKKLKAGETPHSICKDLGVEGGRAHQEMTAALKFIQNDAVDGRTAEKLSGDNF